MVKSIESLESRVLLSAIRINAGGAAQLDSIGRSFVADANFVGGSVQQAAPYDVANTDDDALFLDWREGSAFSFSSAVTNGHYALWLEFADAASIAAGQRVFDVSAESQLILNHFDVFAATGAGTAVARSFDVTVTDGQLNLSFNASSGAAMISAIVLTPTDASTEAKPYSWEAMDDTARTVRSASNLRNVGFGVFLYANEHRGTLPHDLTTLSDQSYTDPTDFGSPRTSTRLPRGEMSALEQHAWSSARHDFIYIDRGSMRNIDQNTVLAYENPDRVVGGINVLFGDASVRLLTRSQASVLIGFPDVPPTDPPPAWPSVPPPDAQIVASRDHLLQLGQALLSWSNEHRGVYPSTFAPLVRYGLVNSVELFINPRRGTTQPPPSSWDLTRKGVWAVTHSDYAYLAGGKSGAKFDSVDVVAYEKPEGLSGGINLLFGDGRVELREIDWSSETLAHQFPPAGDPPWMFVNPGATYTLSGQTLTVTSGFVRFTGDTVSTDPSLDVIVAEGATVDFTAGQHLHSLTVNGTANVRTTANEYDPRVLRVESLAIGPNGKLDLYENRLLIDYAGSTSPLAAIQARINTSRHGGDWTGAGGLTTQFGSTSTTLGVMEATSFKAMLGPDAAFDGEPLDDTAVLVKYTWAGDANFDGRVTFDDYVRIDSGFNSHRTGWSNGDFNGDGVVNFDDYVLIDVAFNTQQGTLARRGSGRVGR